MTGRAILWDFDGTLAVRPGLWGECLRESLEHVKPGRIVTTAMLRPGLRDRFPWHRPEVAHPELSVADAWWGAMTPVCASAYVAAGTDNETAVRAAQQVRCRYYDPAAWQLIDVPAQATPSDSVPAE